MVFGSSVVQNRFSKILVVALMCCSVGLHWGLLQSAAWVGMLLDNAQGATLTEAVIKTFDGKHPCKICQMVSEGKKSEKKQDIQNPALKFEIFFSQSGVKLFPPGQPRFSVPPNGILASRDDLPPVPPPRSLHG